MLRSSSYMYNTQYCRWLSDVAQQEQLCQIYDCKRWIDISERFVYMFYLLPISMEHPMGCRTYNVLHIVPLSIHISIYSHWLTMIDRWPTHILKVVRTFPECHHIIRAIRLSLYFWRLWSYLWHTSYCCVI